MADLNNTTALTPLRPQTPVERQMGRIMRAPDGHPGGDMGGAGGGTGESPQGGNNGGGNNGGGAPSNQSGNNSGQEFDAASFWVDPSEGVQPNNSQQQPSPQGNQGGTAPKGEQATLAQAITESISGFNAPEVMNQEAMDALGNGDLTKFNQNLQASLRSSMEQSVKTNVQIMKAFGEHLMSRVEEMISGSFTAKDNKSFLTDAIPAAKNPAVAPMIDAIYQRALSLSNNDRAKAVVMTKNMLRTMASESANDLDLSVAPRGAESDVPRGATNNTNWLESLMDPGR